MSDLRSDEDSFVLVRWLIIEQHRIDGIRVYGDANPVPGSPLVIKMIISIIFSKRNSFFFCFFIFLRINHKLDKKIHFQ